MRLLRSSFIYTRYPPWKSRRAIRFADIHNCAQPGVGENGVSRYWRWLIQLARLEEAQHKSEKDW